jgi:hypothetical protein
MYETGGMRRVYLQGRSNILKRLLVHGAAFNLSLILRHAIGVDKPRRLQGAIFAVPCTLAVHIWPFRSDPKLAERPEGYLTSQSGRLRHCNSADPLFSRCLKSLPSATGC